MDRWIVLVAVLCLSGAVQAQTRETARRAMLLKAFQGI
jgi:hypothetical protein